MKKRVVNDEELRQTCVSLSHLDEIEVPDAVGHFILPEERIGTFFILLRLHQYMEEVNDCYKSVKIELSGTSAASTNACFTHCTHFPRTR